MNNKTSKARIFTSLRWSAFSSVLQLIFSFIVPLILARLLVPEDFGLVAMAAVFTGISSLLLDFGTGSAIIQKLKQDIEFQSSIFWFNVFMGLLIWGMIVIVAPYIAKLYGNLIITQIIYVSSFSIILQSINILPAALLKKKMDFYSLAITSLISQFIGAIIAVTMAWNNFGYWSIVFSGLFNTVFFSIVLWTRSKWIPKFSFHLLHIKEIFRFSSLLTGTKILNYFERNADKFIIGYFLGSASLGLYSIAYSCLRKPMKMVNGFLSPVVYSIMSENQNDLTSIKKLYLESTQALAMVFFPIAVTMIIFADPLVNLILGVKWTSIIPLVPFFATILFFKPLHKINPEVFKALDKTDILFKLWIVFTPIIIAGFLIGSRFGIIGVSASYTITSFLLFLTSTYITKNMINISINEIFINIKNVMTRSIFLALFYIIINLFLLKYEILFIGLTPLVIILGVIFYAALQKVWPVKSIENLFVFLKISNPVPLKGKQ